MSDPSLALQKAVNTALRAANVCGGRVYDRVPGGAAFPYCTIGEDQMVDNSNSCWDATEAFVTVHVWSRGVGHVEAKAEAAKVRDALNTELALDAPFKACLGEYQGTRYPPSPEGLSTHAVLTFRYIIQH